MDEVATSPAVALLVAERFEELSGQLRVAARYLLDHADDAALHSMRELAQRAGLPPVTFVRLARALGFADYSSLRDRLRAQLRDAGAARRYSGKARDLQLRGPGGTAPAELTKELFEAEIDNLELTFGKNHPDAVAGALDMIDA